MSSAITRKDRSSCEFGHMVGSLSSAKGTAQRSVAESKPPALRGRGQDIGIDRSPALRTVCLQEPTAARLSDSTAVIARREECIKLQCDLRVRRSLKHRRRPCGYQVVVLSAFDAH